MSPVAGSGEDEVAARGAVIGGASPDPSRVQEGVNAYFGGQAELWLDLYGRQDSWSRFHQLRMERALAWIRSLDLAPGARALEIGCGVGLLACEVAKAGARVVAIDTAPEMLALARRHAQAVGQAERITFRIGDAHALDYADGSFDICAALGVVPWLHTPARALAEMHRVLRPGGHLVVSADNVVQLRHLLDPRFTPALAALKGVARRGWRHIRTEAEGVKVREKKHWPGELDRLLAAVGFRHVASTSVGFGPVTFLGRPILPSRIGRALDTRLQGLADRGSPLLRRAGVQYLVLARS